MEHEHLIKNISSKELSDFRNNSTFTFQLTLEDFKNFFDSCGLEIKDVEMCNRNYELTTVKFVFNSKTFFIMCSDIGIAIQDSAFDVDDTKTNLNIESLVEILENHWLIFMHEKFGYEYLVAYPTLDKNLLKRPNYVSKVSEKDFKEFIIKLLSELLALGNYFYGITKEDVDIQEVKTINPNERFFIIRKISSGEIIYLKFSDFNISPTTWGLTKYYKFMHKHFGDAYLQNLRENAIKRLHEEEVPKYIEICTKKIDETIRRIISMK